MLPNQTTPPESESAEAKQALLVAAFFIAQENDAK